ncbi:hypothetical protein [Ruminococcus sp.]|uniref:Ger(x)C family spore germination protein n=1 Tax=Ruminococcus sp. TaxID=41978 RepID=UPI002628618F|nr:hypothetical protein [Ruminococcus sp.]MDD6988857.1 hypothetical protein [Ruminococcus sp.]MDY6202663.1 hypothetical protein [Ruminococcus sp.]
MPKKIILILLCVLSILFSGCSSSKQVDKASIAETVTAGEKDGRICYTFYLLSSSDTPVFTSVFADSFEQACTKAKSEYIPNLSLSKLELFITEEKIMDKTLKSDIKYISEKPYFSPLLYVTLCDDSLVEKFVNDKKLPEQVEEHIVLIKNKNKDISLNCLSIFNNFFSDINKEFSVSYINSDKEIKAESIKINAEK